MRDTGSKARSAARQIGVSSSAIQRAGEQKSTGPRNGPQRKLLLRQRIDFIGGPGSCRI